MHSPLRLLTAAVLLAASLTLTTSGATPAAADPNETPDGDTAHRSISAGFSHSCVVRADASVACWGGGAAGQLGEGATVNRGDGAGEMGAALVAVDLGTGAHAVQVATGTGHSCALLDDGSVKCWGRNLEGQLGYGDNTLRGGAPGDLGDALPTVDLGTGRSATAITAGGNSTCALLDDGRVKCWGDNSSGQLGQGSTTNLGDGAGEMGDALPAVDLGPGLTATAVATGGSSTCALLNTDQVKCWGFGSNGRLGYEDLVNRGDGPGEMGNALPTVDLGTGHTAKAVAVGGAHVCVILEDDSVKCWGSPINGELGQGNAVFHGANPGTMGDGLPTVALGTGRTAAGISAGAGHTCVLLDDASVKCWGLGSSGQLGHGSTTNLGDGAGEMGDALPAVDLGTGHTARAVTTGTDFSCAVLDDASVRCWGNNVVGRLGHGDTVLRGNNPAEMGDALPVTDPGGPVGPAPSLAATLTADQSSVPEGGDVDLHLTLTNTGGVGLTGITVTSAAAPACDGTVTDLAIGQEVVLDCTRTTARADVGTLAIDAAVDSAETDGFTTNQVVVTVDGHQPDGRVRLGAGALVGNGVYNLTAVGQARSANVPNRGTARFTVSAQNDGTVVDDLRLSGPGSTNRFTVTYRLGATNITAGVVAGTRVLQDVSAGATRAITVTITARNGTPRNATIARKLTIRSATTNSADAVKMTVTRR